ncbi:hypothetical protein QYE76_025513 [Lolium multiflorum]|uniref:Reverse transcriptase domain-containing protein n=1 Tax=Lolium multiflorum TaxID=4521 RepID=A0AAD8RFU9_LOLMU|nr:hypothetical protein QYE76_025513 [Lolium multiflorum]
MTRLTKEILGLTTMTESIVGMMETTKDVSAALREGMSRLPTIESCPECRQKKKDAGDVSVFKRLGPLPSRNKQAESSRVEDLEELEDEEEEEEEEEDKYHRPRKRTPDEAEELLARISRNHDDWNTPEPTPTPILKKRGLIELNDDDMREAKKSLKEKDKLIPTDISLQMADKSTAIPVGICEDVPVQVTNNCLILTDFVVLEMPEDDNMSIILGRPFLNTAGAVIDCNKGKVTFNVDDKEHTVYFPKRIDKKRKMKKFNFGELFKRGTTSTGRPSRTATRLRRSYNEDIIAPSFAPEEDNGAPNASSFPCYDFLRNAGILDDFFTLVNRAGLATYVGDEREQYYMLTKIFVESFKFHNTQYEPTVAFKIYGNPVTMELEEFCRALDIAPVGTARRIDDNPRDLLELYRGITDDDCRTIQRGKIRNIQLPAIKYFAYYIATSILDNMVYRMLFADGDEKEIPLPQPGLFNIEPWSRTKEEVDEHMKIQDFHQQHDSEDAEPSYDYTVTYPGASSSTYPEYDPSSSYYGDTTSWARWD